MSFGTFTFVWWLVGYISLVVFCPKQHDVTWGELLGLFPFFAIGGFVLSVMIIAETYGGKVAIKRRD